MTDATLRVGFAGPHVTLQDAGRPGLMRYGVPASGPMDRHSLAIANAALGNPIGQAGIDISLGGVALQCTHGAMTLALAGGGFIADVAGRKFGSWCVFTLRQGEVLTVRPGPWGSWASLAIAGRLVADPWLGSLATHGASGFGGGRLTTAQTLTVADAEVRAALEGPVPCPVWARPRHLLRCVMGPQDRFFSPEAVADFTSARFAVTDAVDRMGMRLRGPALPPVAALSIPSEAVVRGSVQVSGDGAMAVLLSDHQTTGGYPKIATVIAPDLDSFVQCRPGDLVRFAPLSPVDAVQATRRHVQRVDAFVARIRVLRGGAA